MKKRKRSTIRKARRIILNTANEFQKSGIDCTYRSIVVGGTSPKLVEQVRKDEQEKNQKKRRK